MLDYITWNVDPYIFHIFGHPIAWYGLLFSLGLVILGPSIEIKMFKHEGLPDRWIEKMFYCVLIGTIVGARLGHVLFYQPDYYFAHPLEIIQIWKGGLASHGGVIGLLLSMWYFSKKISHEPYLWGLDRLAVPTGLVAAMIRMGNLMNSEIFGYPTTLPWGFRFIRSDEYLKLVPKMDMGCHPTAIYEAICYLIVFAVCMWLYWKKDMARKSEGFIVGFFLFGIFIARFFIEFLKNVQVSDENFIRSTIGMDLGQLLSIPFIIAGIALMIRGWKIYKIRRKES